MTGDDIIGLVIYFAGICSGLLFSRVLFANEYRRVRMLQGKLRCQLVTLRDELDAAESDRTEAMAFLRDLHLWKERTRHE